MDGCRYETKRGKVLLVMLAQEGWGTFEEDPAKPGIYTPKRIQALPPIRATFEEAQADLDAYAQQMDYNPAMPPGEESGPTDASGAADATQPVGEGSVDENQEGGASPPPENQPACPPAPDQDSEKRLRHLQDLLEGCCGRLISTKVDKAASMSHFNGIIKGIEEEMDNLLHEIQTTRYGIEHPSPQPALPFHEAAPSPQPEASEGTAEESQPPEEIPEEPAGREEPTFEEDIPTAEAKEAEIPAAPDEPAMSLPFNEAAPCLACGHPWESAHFGADGSPRACAVIGCDCMASLFQAKPPREAAS